MLLLVSQPGSKCSRYFCIAGCRGAYQRATQVPCTGLDQLWRAYEVFEQNGSSRALARRVLEQQRPRYQAARTALGPRTRHHNALNLTALPFSPGESWSQVVLELFLGPCNRSCSGLDCT